MLKEREVAELLNHYKTFLGDVEELEYQPQVDRPHKLKLIISRANEHRPYNVVGTIGMSATKLKGLYSNCELVMLLDENWKFKMDNINHNWPFELINKIANVICLSKDKVNYGQYFINDNNQPFCHFTDMGVGLLAIPAMFDPGFFEMRAGRKVTNFFVLTTATFDELKLIKHVGGINFIQRYLMPEGEKAFIIHNNNL